jgi:DNA repair protein RadD
MVGRGFRLCPGKTDCLVLDYGGNVLRHGPVDQINADVEKEKGTGEAPMKECPSCHEYVLAAAAVCPQCGHEFPPRAKAKHEAKASEQGILTGQATETTYAVRSVHYSVHVKRDAPADHPRTLRVEYEIGWKWHQSEWICLEHPAGSYARGKAHAWWSLRSNLPAPETIDEAVEIARAGGLAPTLSITVRTVAGEKYARIVNYQLGDKPLGVDPGDADETGLAAAPMGVADEDIPF